MLLMFIGMFIGLGYPIIQLDIIQPLRLGWIIGLDFIYDLVKLKP